MGKLLFFIILIFSSVSFVLGWNWCLHENPISLPQVIERVSTEYVEVLKIATATPEYIPQETECLDELSYCWYQYNDLALKLLQEQEDYKTCEVDVVTLQGDKRELQHTLNLQLEICNN